MGLNAFLFWSRKTWQEVTEIPVKYINLLHAVMGLAGEAGEVLDLLKKQLFTPWRLKQKGIDFKVALSEELGDVLYYFVRIVDIMGFDLDSIMERVVNKLEKRYEEAGLAK